MDLRVGVAPDSKCGDFAVGFATDWDLNEICELELGLSQNVMILFVLLCAKTTQPPPPTNTTPTIFQFFLRLRADLAEPVRTFRAVDTWPSRLDVQTVLLPPGVQSGPSRTTEPPVIALAGLNTTITAYPLSQSLGFRVRRPVLKRSVVRRGDPNDF